MPRLETVKNSNVFSWGEAYFELCSERPLGLMPSISFRAEKDQNTVIKSMIHLPVNFKLILVGEGPLKNSSQMLVQELCLKDRVFFLGNRDDVSGPEQN